MINDNRNDFTGIKSRVEVIAINQQVVNLAKKVFNFAGKHTDPIVPVVIIAVFKAILRPAYTLSQKHQPVERKRYAAAREFLTELVAIPSYLITSKLASGPITDFLAKKYNVPIADLPKVRKVSSFFGITLAAGILIPVICNAILPRVMKLYESREKKKLHTRGQKINIVSGQPLLFSSYTLAPPDLSINKVPYSIDVWNHYKFTNPSGMKVGFR